MVRTRKIAKLEIPLGEGVHLKEGERPLTTLKARTPKQIGEAMRLRRRELGYTQQTLAALTGHSARVIGDIERGRATVGLGVVLDCAMVLDIDFVLTVRGSN